MRVRLDLTADRSKPREPGVSVMSHAPRNAKVEDGLGRARALLDHAPPAGVASACLPISDHSIANEIEVHTVFVGRPVSRKIVKKSRPVILQTIAVEVGSGKREPVIDAYQCRSARDIRSRLAWQK